MTQTNNEPISIMPDAKLHILNLIDTENTSKENNSNTMSRLDQAPAGFANDATQVNGNKTAGTKRDDRRGDPNQGSKAGLLPRH
jgi:hypothetical protein